MPEPPGMQTVAELQTLCLEAQVDRSPAAQLQPAQEEDEYIEDVDDDFE